MKHYQISMFQLEINTIENCNEKVKLYNKPPLFFSRHDRSNKCDVAARKKMEFVAYFFKFVVHLYFIGTSE